MASPLTPTPMVSIVVRTFNLWDCTRRCLAALGDHTGDIAHEIIVVDDGSTDETAHQLPLLRHVRHHRNPFPLGFARAANQGAALARGRYLLFLDRDAAPTPGWLAPLVAEAERDDTVAIVGGKLLDADGAIQRGGVIFAYAGPEPITPVHLHRGQPAGTSQRRLELRGVTAACMLARGAVFHEVGGFDEAFVDAGEDVDLCLKVWRSGRKIVFTPDSVVVDHGPAREGPFQLGAADADRLNCRWMDRFDAFDVDFRADARPAVVDPGRPAASVIAVVHDALGAVAPCLENIRYTMGSQDELIVVDDASRGAVAAFVAQFAARHPGQVRLIRDDRPLGFSRAAGRGLAAATRPYAALLGSNVRVVGDWIDRLRAHLEARPGIGAISASLGDSARLEPAELLYPINATAANRPAGYTDAPALAAGDVEAIRFPCSVTLFGRRDRLAEVTRLDPDVLFADDAGALAELLATCGLSFARAKDVVVYKFNQNAPHPDPSLYGRYLETMSQAASARALATVVVHVPAGGPRERARDCVDTIARCADRELDIKVVTDGDSRSRDQLAAEQARYVAVVDADAVVTPGWLARQIALLAVDPTLSVVGPAMNDARGAQRIGRVTYRRLDDLPAFAACWAIEHLGEHAMFPLSSPGQLDSLCRVMPRRIFVGDLDAQIGRTPLRAGIAFDAFVHRRPRS